jgi:glycosyltransferase involved in cell wall biosynthesis
VPRDSARTVPVAVVIPAYNAKAHIASALESIAAQTVRPAELIVVDDASIDGTASIAAAGGARVVAQRCNAGPSAARNAGVAASRSPWIAFLDADDRWLPDKLARQWETLERWPDIAFCITDYLLQQADGNVLSGVLVADPAYRAIARTATSGDAVRLDAGSFARALVRSMFVRQSSAVVRRDLFLRSGGYERGRHLAEDYDLFIRLTAHGPAAAIERPLVEYCRRRDSLSADPLAEVWSIDALWGQILGAPERYPVGIEKAVSAQRPLTLRKGAAVALRLGRFAEAEPFLRELSRFDTSLGTLSLYGLWSALRSPLGQRVHGAVRTAWRRRPRPAKPQSSPRG